MEPVSVNQQVRPHRFAFVINSDLAPLLEVVRVNSVLWGGIYNPILLIGDQLDKAHRERSLGLLADFDPDFLVNYSGTSLPKFLEEAYPDRVLEKNEFVGRWRGRASEIKGVDILPLLRLAWREEVRISKDPTNVVLPQTPAGSDWLTYSNIVFGDLSDDLGVDYREHFVRALLPRILQVPSDIAKLLSHDVLTPIQFTGYELRFERRGGSLPYFLIFVGDTNSVDDLTEFWNLRATGREVLLLPSTVRDELIEPAKQLMEQGKPTDDRRIPRLEILQGQSVPKADFDKVRAWFTDFMAGEPYMYRTFPVDWGRDVPMVSKEVELGSAVALDREEAALLHGDSLSPIRVSIPSYLEWKENPREYTWSVVLDFSETFNDKYCLSLPMDPSVDALARRRMLIGMPNEVRVAREGLVTHRLYSRDVMNVTPILTADVFASLFKTAGFGVRPSPPGRFADRILDHMKGVDGCRVFKIKGVREVLSRMRGGKSLQSDEIIHTIGKHWNNKDYDDLIITYQQSRPLTPVIVFDAMVRSKILRAGLRLVCTNCGKEDWHHVDAFGETFRCQYCSSVQDVGNLDRMRWYYKTNGMFMLPGEGLGSIPVILGLWRLKHLGSLGHYKYSTSLGLTRTTGGGEYEVDFCCLNVDRFRHRHELVLGEARGQVAFSSHDIGKLVDVAASFRSRPYLAFVTLRDEYSDLEKQQLKKLSQDGWQVIALTRQELDPYDLHDRFKNARRKHVVSLSDLSENTSAINL
jgi:hypothetical protein